MVRTRTIDLAKETFWREQLERQAASGLSIAAWCRQNQVAITSFHYWRRTIARRDKPIAIPQPEPALAATAFVPVFVETASQVQRPQPDPLLHDADWIEIHFQHHSARVRVAPGFDAPTLLRLLDVLEQRTC